MATDAIIDDAQPYVVAGQPAGQLREWGGKLGQQESEPTRCKCVLILSPAFPCMLQLSLFSTLHSYLRDARFMNSSVAREEASGDELCVAKSPRGQEGDGLKSCCRNLFTRGELSRGAKFAHDLGICSYPSAIAYI